MQLTEVNITRSPEINTNPDRRYGQRIQMVSYAPTGHAQLGQRRASSTSREARDRSSCARSERKSAVKLPNSRLGEAAHRRQKRASRKPDPVHIFVRCRYLLSQSGIFPAIRGSVRGASESRKNWRSESNNLFSFKYEGKNKAIVRIANVLILQRPQICNLVRRTRIR